MKKTTLLLFLLLTQLCLGQKLFNDNIEDTLSIDNFGKKIELENDLKESERLNNILILEVSKRKKVKDVSKKTHLFYENIYLILLLNQAYYDNKRGDYKNEIAVYFDILKNKKANLNVLAYTYNAIGISFSEIGDYKKSIYYCEQSLLYHKKDNNIDGVCGAYDNLGDLYTQINQLNKALTYFQKSIKHGEKSYNKSILGSTYNNLANVYVKKKEYQKAIDNFKEGIKIAKKYKNHIELSSLYFNIGDVYCKIGDNVLCEKYKQEAFQLAQATNHLNILKNAGKDLSAIYKKKNLYEKSLFYYEIANAAKDTLEKKDNKNAILKAEFKHDTEKKETQIKDLHQETQIAKLESDRQKTLVLILIISLLLLGIIGYFMFYRFRIKKKNEVLRIQLEEVSKTIDAEKRAAESELKALKSQMNPHFIFNALNGIQEQFMFGNKEVANEQMGNFTYLTRQILNVSGKKKIPVATEIEILTKYLELEKMRFHKDFEYEIHLDENIDDYYTQIPPMLIQPFVENSIKHGLLHREGNKKVSIDFTMNETENTIICTIIDNGIGREKSAKIKVKNDVKHESFSTKSIDQRLEIWNEGLENSVVYEDVLNNDDEITGTKVVLTIAIH